MSRFPLLHQHHKGAFYFLVDIVDDSTDDVRGKPWDRRFAIYYSLEKKKLCVREHHQFRELIQWPDGATRPRFTPLDEFQKEKPPAIKLITDKDGFIVMRRGQGDIEGTIEDAKDLRDQLVNWLGYPSPTVRGARRVPTTGS